MKAVSALFGAGPLRYRSHHSYSRNKRGRGGASAKAPKHLSASSSAAVVVAVSPGSPTSRSSLPAQSGNPPPAAAQTVHLRGSLPQQVCCTQPSTVLLLLQLRLKIGVADRELKWLHKRWEPEEGKEDEKAAIAAQAHHPQSNLSRPGNERRLLDNTSISLRVLGSERSTLGHAIYLNSLTHLTKKEKKKKKSVNVWRTAVEKKSKMSSWSPRSA